MTSSNMYWQKRGFGWVPDLPDISDPNLESLLGDKTRIQTQETTDDVEDVVASLINLLEEKFQNQLPETSTTLQGLRRQLLGDTVFPKIRIYKVLRQGVEDQETEVTQLKEALYWIYQRCQKELSSHPLPDSFREKFTGPDIRPIKWLQDPMFDSELDMLVRDFQEWAGLVKDGIVGLRTLTKIRAILSPDFEAAALSIPNAIALLCPPSLTPHDILAEIFDQLTHRWLYGKFRLQIDQAFQIVLKSYPLESRWTEELKIIQTELDDFCYEILEDITLKLRAEIKVLSVQALKINPQQKAYKADIEILLVKLDRFKDSLLKKVKELLDWTDRNISPEIQERLTSKNIGWQGPSTYSNQIDTCLSTLQQLIEDQVCQLWEKNVFDNTFILYSYESFVGQYQIWFHIIESFVSAIIQILSPLASFDNFKVAVKKGFERLDSCFQLHHLENRTKLVDYKKLLAEYSPDYLSDSIHELRCLQQSVNSLFNEALIKINRKQYEDLDFRDALIDGLIDYLKGPRGYHNTAKSTTYPNQENSEEDAFLEIAKVKVGEKLLEAFDEDRWENWIKPAAHELFHSRITVAKVPAASAQEMTSKDEKIAALDKEVKDLCRFVSFFEFIKDILKSQYGIKPSNSHQIEGDQSNVVTEPNERIALTQKQADLKSLLATKTELFEIQDFEKIMGKRSQSQDSLSPRFFEPVTLQLPINANLLDLSLEPHNEGVEPYFFLPGVVDLSYWCSPVEDQGTINACTAFAGVALVEYFAQKRYGKYTNLSPRFLYKVARNLMGRQRDVGASVRQTMKALVLLGVPPEEVWPWDESGIDEEPLAFCYAYAQSYQALKYFRLDSVANAPRELLLFQIKAVLAAGLPCIFGFTVYSSFYKENNVRRGYIPYPSQRDQVVGGHAAVAVGYNDYKSINRVDGQPTRPGAILIRNSWGTSWGNGGYGWLPYDYIIKGLTADWWSLLKSEWFEGGAFGLGAVDPGTDIPEPTDPFR